MENKQVPITLKEIAQLAGVSLGTVDRVLHKRGRFSEKTALKIEKIIQEQNYQPNLNASLLKKNKTHTLFVLLPNQEQDGKFWTEFHQLYKNKQATMRQNGIALNLKSFDRDSIASFWNELEVILKTAPDFIIFPPLFDFSESELAKLKDWTQGIPLLTIDTHLPALENIFTLSQSNKSSAALSARLLAMGLPKKSLVIALTPRSRDPQQGNRLLAFEEALKTHFNDLHYQQIELSDQEFLAMDEQIQPLQCSAIFIPWAGGGHWARQLRQAGFQGLISCYDLTDHNKAALKSGELDFVIGQRPSFQVEKSLELASTFFSLGKTHEKLRVHVPVDVITKENLPYYY